MYIGTLTMYPSPLIMLAVCRYIVRLQSVTFSKCLCFTHLSPQLHYPISTFWHVRVIFLYSYTPLSLSSQFPPSFLWWTYFCTKFLHLGGKLTHNYYILINYANSKSTDPEHTKITHTTNPLTFPLSTLKQTNLFFCSSSSILSCTYI